MQFKYVLFHLGCFAEGIFMKKFLIFDFNLSLIVPELESIVSSLKNYVRWKTAQTHLCVVVEESKRENQNLRTFIKNNSPFSPPLEPYSTQLALYPEKREAFRMQGKTYPLKSV